MLEVVAGLKERLVLEVVVAFFYDAFVELDRAVILINQFSMGIEAGWSRAVEPRTLNWATLAESLDLPLDLHPKPRLSR